MSEVVRQPPLLDSSLESTPVAPRRLPYHTFSDLLIPISTALDLAEGRSPGHAQRLAYIAMVIADAAGLDQRTRLACCYAGLLHDIGAVAAGAGLSALIRGDERLIFAALPLLTPEEAAVGASEDPELVVERIIDHVIHGARAAQDLDLPAEVVKAISAHHECWDGTGYPHGLRGEDIPVLGRIIAIADQIDALIDQTTPLLARRNFTHWLSRLAGKEADPQLISILRDLGSGDLFWLGLFGADLPGELSSRCAGLREPKSMRLLAFAESFAQLIDARFSFTAGASGEVAKFSESLGRALGMTDLRLKQLRLAALLHDVGQLAVSERIMAKPGILSVEELDVLRHHAYYSHDVIGGIAGFEEVADWVAAHHERVDGRGYPEGRAVADIPLEARILAVADAYVAITSDRPHRPAGTAADAKRRLLSAAGSQLDASLVELFLAKVIR